MVVSLIIGLRVSEILRVNFRLNSPGQATMDFSLRFPKVQFVSEMYLLIVTMVFGFSTVLMLKFITIHLLIVLHVLLVMREALQVITSVGIPARDRMLMNGTDIYLKII